MDYSKALKEVQTMEPTRSGFMLLNLGYDNTILLPHKDGVALLACLASAEQFHKGYNEPTRIEALAPDKITASLMSRKDYQRHKMAELLHITYDAVILGEKPPIEDTK